MYNLTKYKYYLYPLSIFIILFFILFLIKLFQKEPISLLEEEKKYP